MTDTPLTAEELATLKQEGLPICLDWPFCKNDCSVCNERDSSWERILATCAALTERAEKAERDRDKAETTLEMVKALADGYGWLSEGRGSYEWDDGRYDDDVRTFTGQLLELLPSGNWLGMREWEAKYRKAEARVAELTAALTEQGLLQKKADGSMVWHVHDCRASFDFAQCNYHCRVARAALEGK